MAWSQVFLVSILSLSFFQLFIKPFSISSTPYTFFISSSSSFPTIALSNFISLSTISFFNFLLFFFFGPFDFSWPSPSLSGCSSFFYPHMTRHLTIFTSPFSQFISGLWATGHSMLEIILAFLISHISIFSLSICSLKWIFTSTSCVIASPAFNIPSTFLLV